MADFQTIIQKERDRLSALRTDALQRRDAIVEEISGIDRELKAITAYETAKIGKAPKKATGTRRASRTDAILNLLKGNQDGLTRSLILEKLGFKGDKTAEQSVSNALNNLKKAGKIASDSGNYTLA